jgi:hypothetical protein
MDDCAHTTVYVDPLGNEVCLDCGVTLPPALFDDGELDEPLSPLDRARER